MLRRILTAAAILFSLSASIDVAAAAPPEPGLKAFRSEAELRRFLKAIARTRGRSAEAQAVGMVPPPPAPPGAESITVTSNKSADSITNNQEAGVDEGDIVKAKGDFLVVLRRGRLFTVSLAAGHLKPIDRIDAYPPGVDAGGDWYDEMLIAGDRIIVIGYSYTRGGTQVNRFHVDAQGHLTFEDAYAFRSNDYYSSRNYASRLIGNRLVLYSPRYLPWSFEDASLLLPGMHRWSGEARVKKFRPIGSAQNVFMSAGLTPEEVGAIHTVTSCDVTQPVLACNATSVLGQEGRVFYVSANAVYVWVSAWNRKKGEPAMLYRLPLDGSRPQAVKVEGVPVDQFSFRESGQTLDVLVRAYGGGDAMWQAESKGSDAALLQMPLSLFGDGRDATPAKLYRGLPLPQGPYRGFHNRYVGDYLLYGEGNAWDAPQGMPGIIGVVPLKGGPLTSLELPHGVDRIEIMGRDAVVVGSGDGNVFFSTVLLQPGKHPALGDRYTLAGAAQGETRSHGFYFQPESGNDADGVLGLPVFRPAEPAYRQLYQTSAAVVFLRRSAGQFALLGELPSHPGKGEQDFCQASCVDWYGNARPIFYRGRAFALMGYEVVEAALHQKDMQETGRTNFAPKPPTPAKD